jgi:hypothetical protein
MNIDLKDITNKKQMLEQAKLNLKEYFVGIDDVIDKIFSMIEVWFLMPDLLMRPTIINLWGMTGHGKTDLIRKLVYELNFDSEYIEIQLDTNSDSYSSKSIQYSLINNGVSSKRPSILLLDEIQRFRSIDEEGAMIENHAYSDIWELLSDGSFCDANKEQDELYQLLVSLLYDEDYRNSDDEKDTKESSDDEVAKPKKKHKYQSYYWEANRFKNLLELEDSIENIMTWNFTKKINLIKDKLGSITKNRERKTYNKVLIFICGNLDEAYSMANDTSQVTIDGDILHDFTKDISILDIKEQLRKKFKPEQIARLGNNHILYTSLTKKDYEVLINKKLNDIRIKIKTLFDVDISFDEEIKKAIYRNGVYPTQGVRPLLSTIGATIENTIPNFLYSYFSNKIDINNKMMLTIKDKTVMAVIENGDIFEKDVSFDIDNLIRKIDKKSIAQTATHESGHVLIYCILFNRVPSQVVCDDPSTYTKGFVMPHTIDRNKENVLNKICIYLAGMCAEEIVFGEGLKSSGANVDICSATFLASSYVREWNMDGYVGKIVSETHSDSSYLLNFLSNSSEVIEEILKQQKSKVTDIINNNKPLFKEIVTVIQDKRRLNANDLYDIVRKHIPNIENTTDKIIYSYDQKLQKFLGE